jgi:hypothetical protein
MVDQAPQIWAAKQQRSAMELQFVDKAESDPAELDMWRQVRRESVRRMLKRG